MTISPVSCLRTPAKVSFKGLAKAPAGLLVAQVWRSLSHSVSVGSLKPVGQGLLVPLVPCHKLSFCEARQSWGSEMVVIKLACPGLSESAGVGVVKDVLI